MQNLLETFLFRLLLFVFGDSTRLLDPPLANAPKQRRPGAIFVNNMCALLFLPGPQRARGKAKLANGIRRWLLGKAVHFRAMEGSAQRVYLFGSQGLAADSPAKTKT